MPTGNTSYDTGGFVYGVNDRVCQITMLSGKWAREEVDRFHQHLDSGADEGYCPGGSDGLHILKSYKPVVNLQELAKTRHCLLRKSECTNTIRFSTGAATIAVSS